MLTYVHVGDLLADVPLVLEQVERLVRGQHDGFCRQTVGPGAEVGITVNNVLQCKYL